ncbi:hypothetical protein BDV40DRAFT_266641 [Aspergillus tamarii]|uniref:Uncharacterized protein n=1 Tax=Aspergillus tamarii TaxID=41984 RepID=A0A5N6USZ8_ASPTM|nr:hypothetical protein BDV40DRAFT_266641 [Aspergillus tamarii]
MLHILNFGATVRSLQPWVHMRLENSRFPNRICRVVKIYLGVTFGMALHLYFISDVYVRSSNRRRDRRLSASKEYLGG